MIYYTVSFSLDAVGGHQAATVEKIEALRRLDHDVQVFSPKKSSGPLSALFLLWVEICVFLCAVKSNKKDIFIFRGWVGVLALMVLRVKGGMVAREVHSDLVEESEHISDGVRRLLLTVIGYYTVLLDLLCGYLIFNHPCMQSHFKKKYKGRAEGDWYYNGVSPSKFNSPLGPHPEEIFSLQPYLVFVGNVSKWHGLDKAIDCFLGSSTLREKYSLVVIGPLSDPSGFERYHGCPEVLFLGRRSNREVQHWIRESEACLLPVNPVRVSPGSPLKLYEYLAHGKPVFTQENVIGYSDVVTKFGAGVCVDFFEVDATASRLESYLLGLPVENKSVVDTVKNEITWDVVMEKWLAGIVRYYQ